MKSCSWIWLFFLTLLTDIHAQHAAPLRRSVAIHWQRVPLGDALLRLERAFDATIFRDRRVDPNARVSLDIQASSIHEVLMPVAAQHALGVAALRGLVYLGPPAPAEQLPAVAEARLQDVARLPGRQRAALLRQRRLMWPRLTEPRRLITSLLEEGGWQVHGTDRIAHDLWPAGELPEMALAEQLTVLLVGFDLTFEIRANERAIAVVPLEGREPIRPSAAAPVQAAPPPAQRPRKTKQVYTLRVEQQPVGVVLRELTKRLNWAIEIDDEAIRGAGRSLETRVSFTVDDAEQDELLEALLRPAGLDFRREGARIKIVPRP
jgi:hypothetical protein